MKISSDHQLSTAELLIKTKTCVTRLLIDLRGFFRPFYPEVWVAFNLDILLIFCVKLIYFHKSFYLSYDIQEIENFKYFDFGENDQF